MHDGFSLKIPRDKDGRLDMHDYQACGDCGGHWDIRHREAMPGFRYGMACRCVWGAVVKYMLAEHHDILGSFDPIIIRWWDGTKGEGMLHPYDR